MSVTSAGNEAGLSRWRAGPGRHAAGTALLTAVAMLRRLSGNNPAPTVLRVRSADLDPPPKQLASCSVTTEAGLGAVHASSALAGRAAAG